MIEIDLKRPEGMDDAAIEALTGQIDADLRSLRKLQADIRKGDVPESLDDDAVEDIAELDLESPKIGLVRTEDGMSMTVS